MNDYQYRVNHAHYFQTQIKSNEGGGIEVTDDITGVAKRAVILMSTAVCSNCDFSGGRLVHDLISSVSIDEAKCDMYGHRIYPGFSVCGGYKNDILKS